MESIDCILTRRSIRKYADKPIESEKLEMMIKCGLMAPSARNKQPWHFLIIQSNEGLKDLSDIHPYGSMLAQAGAAILICGDLAIEETESYIIQDCSAAVQNILLAAHGLGLGAVWLGVHPRPDRMEGISNYLGLPEHIIPVALLSVGYPTENVPQPDRRDESKIHYEKWT